MQTIEPDHEWQRPLSPWSRREYHCLCPLTQPQAERADAWACAWREQWKPQAPSGEGWPPPKIQATEHECELALAYARQQLGEDLEQFLQTGERPYSMSSMGGGTFHDPGDPLVSVFIEYNARGICAYRDSEEEKAWKRQWHGFWQPRGHEHHNPGHQARAPMPRDACAKPIGRWEIKWSQIRSLIKAERAAARHAELQPSLF